MTKITKELIKIRKYNLTKSHKQRIAGLLNFWIPILRLPYQSIQLVYHHYRKLLKYVNFIYYFPMYYQQFLNDLPVYKDTTAKENGIIGVIGKPILENEYLGILISHIVRETSISSHILASSIANMLFLFASTWKFCY